VEGEGAQRGPALEGGLVAGDETKGRLEVVSQRKKRRKNITKGVRSEEGN